RGHCLIGLHNRHRLRADRSSPGRSAGYRAARACIASTQRKVCDVDFILSQNGSHLTNHSRHVTVTKNREMSFERRLDMEAIQMEQPRRAAGQNNSTRAMFTLMSSHGK